MIDHWFWWLLTAACIVWYSTVTIYVAFKGIADIRTMIKHLSNAHESTENGPQE